MRNSILSFLVLACLPVLLRGQVLADAVRYSFLEAGSTARSAAVGGGMGALGADFSVLSTNPAGLAAYRRSELTFSPSVVSIGSEGQLDGSAAEKRNKLNFNFANMGLVLASQPRSFNWTSKAFAFGFNRMANFHQRSYFSGASAGSITDRWLGLAQGYSNDNLNPFEEGLAYDAEALYLPDANNPTAYASDFLPGEVVQKSQLVKREGAISEMVISYAGNYKDRVMMGMTLGIPFVRFSETKTYVESDPDDTNPVFNELTFTERLSTSGAGINLKAGVVVRVNQMFRVGAAIHTPTAMSLTDDNFSTALDYSYTLNGLVTNNSEQSDIGTSEYQLRTPWRAIGSAGIIIGKSGFITGEVEYVDYTNAKFKFNNAGDPNDDDNERFANDDIQSQLGSALNIRLGGEFALDKFRFRGGYAITPSPYKEGNDPVGTLSLGAGAWWNEYFFTDLAFRRRFSEGSYVPYFLGSEPGQTVDTSISQMYFLLTCGFRF